MVLIIKILRVFDYQTNYLVATTTRTKKNLTLKLLS